MNTPGLPPLGGDELEVRTLPPGFDPGGFRCREPELCSYLLDGDAARDHEAGVTRTYVVLLRENGSLVSYFTLLADSIKLEVHERPQGVPYMTAPAIKLGRFGTDDRFARRGVGEYVLNYIVGLGRSLSEHVGLRYITLDALPRPGLIAYYERFGFLPNVAPAIDEENGKAAKEVSMRFDLRS